MTEAAWTAADGRSSRPIAVVVDAVAVAVVNTVAAAVAADATSR